jgi:sirohydrochlorin ferrochelatase
VSAGSPPLVLAAHGSGDPAFATVVEGIADQVRRSRPDLDVRVGYLEHGPPHLRDVAGSGTIVVPLLLSSGYHVAVDIPVQASGATISATVGPDDRLVPVLASRLREAGWSGEAPVVLVAAGSTAESALQEVRDVGPLLSRALGGAEVTAAFLSAGTPRVSDLPSAAAIASYLLAPGHFSRVLESSGAAIVSAPLGAAPELAEIVLDRYADAAAGAS